MYTFYFLFPGQMGKKLQFQLSYDSCMEADETCDRLLLLNLVTFLMTNNDNLISRFQVVTKF